MRDTTTRRMHRRTVRAIAAGGVLSLALTACGQKPGVHVEGSTGGIPVAGAPADGLGDGDGLATLDGGTAPETLDLGGGDASESTDGVVAAPGTDTGGNVDQSTGSGGSRSDGAGSGPTGPSGPSGPTGGQPGDGQQQTGSSQQASGGKLPVIGSDRTGAGPEKFVFASHAPVTGAAPLPATSFREAGDLYWRDLIAREGDLLGRKEVELIFRDDTYDPAAARQVCQELARQAFVVSGGGGTDQIQACGELAGRVGFPYFSAGVTEAALRGNPWYFAASASYRTQARLLAQYVKTNPHKVDKLAGNSKIALVITDTANFRDTEQGWAEGIKAAGIGARANNPDGTPRILRHPKGLYQAVSPFADKLKADGVEVVFILTAPVDYIRFGQAADEAGVEFQYIGVGVSMGLNAILGTGCNGSKGGYVRNGIFFSPFPGLDWARKNAPEFFAAAEKFGKTASADDIAFALWGTNEVQHKLLLEYEKTFGTDVTREGFRALVERTSVKPKYFPALSYSPDDHFGANQVHVLRADCSIKQYVTLDTFKSSF
jgi:ABC-type branched-subunit amino acid transport system substrate-binding protein